MFNENLKYSRSNKSILGATKFSQYFKYDLLVLIKIFLKNGRVGDEKIENS